jgi:uncharacterized protein with beta-barrel porin domain
VLPDWTVVTVNGASVKCIGIDAGTGNDQVVFGDGSYIGCDLDLGEGNDELKVIGSRADALTLDGATNFTLGRSFDFESLAKLGSSTVSLSNTQMLEQLDVFEGILQINNKYQFTDTGSFSTKVYGGGNCGQLMVTGDLGLDGTMTVVRGPGAYLDGAIYDVLAAGSLSGSFDSILLPDSTPLLSFGLADSGNNGYCVTAATKPFSTVATNKIEQSVTALLDSIVASTHGDLSAVLGEIQGMQPDGYGTAFDSLSPDSYDCSTKTTFSVADQFTQVLSNRLRNLRSTSADRLPDGGVRLSIDRLGFGTASGRAGSSGPAAAYGLWLGGFGQWGCFAPGDGYTGFDFNAYGTTLGYDRYLGRNLTAGASLGYANAKVYFDDDRGAGLAESITGSLYGRYSAERLHIDTAFYYGRQSYENNWNIVVGSVRRTAESNHGSNALLAYLGGGLALGRLPWTIEPQAALQYMYLNEEAFSEEGARSVSLNVRERSTRSLISDLGLLLGLALDIGRRNLVSELYAAWRHDFTASGGTITASFADAPNTSFTIPAPERQADGVLLGASLVLRDIGRFSAALKYVLELHGQYRAKSLSGEIQYGF